jgi:hypothetical protein
MILIVVDRLVPSPADRLFKRVKIYFGLRIICPCGCQVFLSGRVSPYWKKIKKMLGGCQTPDLMFFHA